jgi:hypothetical protein
MEPAWLRRYQWKPFINSENDDMDVKASPPPSNIISSANAKPDVEESNEKPPVADANWREGSSHVPQTQANDIACSLLNAVVLSVGAGTIGALGAALTTSMIDMATSTRTAWTVGVGTTLFALGAVGSAVLEAKNRGHTCT